MNSITEIVSLKYILKYWNSETSIDIQVSYTVFKVIIQAKDGFFRCSIPSNQIILRLSIQTSH